METFNLAQLTKEMVVGQIRNLADPTLVAAEVVRGTLIARLQGRDRQSHELQEAIVEICRGAVAGMVLMDCPLPRGAEAVMRACGIAAKALGIEPAVMATGALKGIADARRFTAPEVLAQIKARVDSLWPGGGEVFEHFCSDLHPDQSHPGYVPPRTSEMPGFGTSQSDDVRNFGTPKVR